MLAHRPWLTRVLLVPGAVPARGLVALATGITYFGIMKLNMAGPGLTATIKSLW